MKNIKIFEDIIQQAIKFKFRCSFGYNDFDLFLLYVRNEYYACEDYNCKYNSSDNSYRMTNRIGKPGIHAMIDHMFDDSPYDIHIKHKEKLNLLIVRILKNKKIMNINLVEMTPDYCVEEEGTYLIRRVSNVMKKISYIEARVSLHEKKGKIVMTIDSSNFLITHISDKPVQ